MKTLTSWLFLGVLAAPLALSASITRTVEKTFAVQPGGKLQADTSGGNITIETADVPQVRVVAKQVIRASSEAEADELLTKLKLTIEQSGNDVTAEAKYERGSFKLWSGNQPVSVSFTITVPSSYNLRLRTSGGNIAVASVRGTVHARTSGGNLTFEKVDGDIDAETSGGDVKLAEGTARARLSTSGGNILVERAGGPTEVSTSGGNIKLRSVAELIRASTSGGNVYAELTEPLKRDTDLSTSGGDVEVRVVKSAAFQLDASTSGGSVRADGLTITLENGGSGKSRLSGSVNGGGPRLKLRTSGGDIRVRTD